MSVIPAERLIAMREAGLTPKDISIIEDLTKMLLPLSRFCDPLEEAVRKWRAIKNMAVMKKAQEEAKQRRLAERSASIVRHGEVESMANGKVYSDKAKYRADLKAMGYVEVGNEDTIKYGEKVRKQIAKERQKKQEADIEAAVAQAMKNVRM